MNTKKITLLIATAVSVLATPALLAQMNHGNMGGMDHSAHQPAPNARTEQAPDLPKPVQAVFDNYIKIQAALAQDSLQGVSANATMIVKGVQTDTAKALPDDVARQAEMLAGAGDIKAAREAFKPLSDSLIKYLGANKAHRGHYVQVFCSMANARWLQTGSVVSNPYYGKSMARCGRIES
jgi:hypothetical protein